MGWRDTATFNIDGRDYNFVGGLGAQLESMEPEALPQGTVRYIGKFLFRMFNCEQKWFKVKCRVTWAMVDMGKGNLDDDYRRLGELRKYLESLI